MSGVSPNQRYSRTRPCPICGGYDGGERGAGHGPHRHCYGFRSDDGRYARCSRAEYAADARYDEKTGTWIHGLEGEEAGRTASYGASDGQRRIAAEYDYRDEAGTVLYQAVRYQPKGFKQRRPDGAGGWIWKLEGVPLVLYRLPELRAADPAATVYIPEGERDVENLRTHGFVATCNAMGAGKWRPEYSDHLRGRHVVILPDCDKPGADHARTVAGALDGIAASVKVLDLPGLPTGGDVSDWLTSGGTPDRLIALAGATREYDASEHPPARDTGEWEAKITLLSDVQPEQVRWLWPGYIPLGKLTVIDGDPGNGKSTVMCDIAARVSTGRAMPDGSVSDLDGPAGVVLLSAEDGPADTIRPRLDAAGADVARVALLECAVSGERERGITLADLDHIETAIAAVGAGLVVIDPLMAFLGGETNSYRDQDMRAVLAPLARLADRTGAAMVVIRHFNKGQAANVLYRGGGSIGIIGAARVGLVIAPDPDELDSPRRVMAVAKSNLAVKPPAMAYRLVQAANGVAYAVWEGATHHTAAMLTNAPPDDEERNAQTDAASVLREILAGGALPADDVKAEAKRAGVSERTLWRAKGKIGIRSRKEGYGDGARWMWELPPEETKSAAQRSVPKDAEACQSNAMADFDEVGTLRGDSTVARSNIGDEAARAVVRLRQWLDAGTLERLPDVVPLPEAMRDYRARPRFIGLCETYLSYAPHSLTTQDRIVELVRLIAPFVRESAA